MALSYDDLKMNGMLKAAQISFSCPATSICSCSDSTTHGPAMRNRGRFSPTSNPHRFMSEIAYATSCARVRGVSLCAARCRSSAALTKAMNSGWPRRGFDVNSGWYWQPKNHGWSSSSIISHRSPAIGALGARADDQAGRLEARQVMIVDFVAVTVPLGDRRRPVDAVRERCRARPRRAAHRAASCRRDRTARCAARSCRRDSAIRSPARRPDAACRASNSVLLASASPAAWRACSITASCMPRQMPRYGMLFSRA